MGVNPMAPAAVRTGSPGRQKPEPDAAPAATALSHRDRLRRVFLIALTAVSVLLAVILGAACGTGHCGSGGSTGALGALPPPAASAGPSYTVGGTVTALGGAPLAGVPVTSSLGTVVTVANGSFTGLPVPGDASTASFIVNKCGLVGTPCLPGYPSYTASLALATGVYAYAKSVALVAMQATSVPAAGLPPTLMAGTSGTASVQISTSMPPPNVSVQVRYGIVPAAAGPGSLRSSTVGNVSNSTLLQVRGLVCCAGVRWSSTQCGTGG